MGELLNIVLGIIASVLTIISFKSAKEASTEITQTGDNNSVYIDNKKVNINNFLMPTQKQIIKIERIIERVVVREKRENSADIIWIIIAFVLFTLFGAIYMSYSFLFATILLALFVFRFILYIQYSNAIRIYSDSYDKSKFIICSIQRLILFCILLSLMFFSVPQELQKVVAHTKFDFYSLLMKGGGTSLANWADGVIKYIRSIWNTTPFYFFLFRSVGVIGLTSGIWYITGKSVLPIYSHNIERWKALLSELCFFIFIAIVFFALYPWIFLDTKNAVEPIVIEWLRK
ncbi:MULTISPECIES: hypothetical protein [Bacillus]|uniref:hypothetical protein n=1 Tax=Bacillus TaxID=1386 RepID=UPI0009B75243|nr:MULTISPECIES: hypothetical protein [Bacillus]ARC72537.1 hypothetical protein B37_00484 [Bacillus licheniformis]ARW41670.1 hypothetical protein S100141_00347 [Bacillus licheniformis]ARW56522.1 hypothetical protein S100027_04558 [Bacillus licheniformis]AXF87790.1 hypothetical protein BLDA23_05690 [Bacillus licheniformis]MCA1182434.1 hypothetical protein [Bacillus licheniformis]